MAPYTNSCGHCKECIRLHQLQIMGRQPCEPMECAYKHILEIYKDGVKFEETIANIDGEKVSSPVGSCSADCRWISGSSSKTTSEDSYGWDTIDMDHVRRKRVIFSKRRRIPK